MKNFGFVSVLAGGLAAAVLGLAAPAQADTTTTNAVTAASVTAVLQTAPTGIDHHDWLNDVQPRAHAPQVDTTVHQSR